MTDENGHILEAVSWRLQTILPRWARFRDPRDPTTSALGLKRIRCSSNTLASKFRITQMQVFDICTRDVLRGVSGVDLEAERIRGQVMSFVWEQIVRF